MLRKNPSNLVIGIISFCFGISGMLLVGSIKNNLFPNPDIGATFVSRCISLTGLDLTLANIRTLNGKVYIAEKRHDGEAVYVGPVEQRHIEQYITALNSEDSSDTTRIKYYNDSFDVSRGRLDNDWRCTITVDPLTGAIRTKPYFAPGGIFD